MLLEAYLSQASFMNNFVSIVFRDDLEFFVRQKRAKVAGYYELGFPLKCSINFIFYNATRTKSSDRETFHFWWLWNWRRFKEYLGNSVRIELPILKIENLVILIILSSRFFLCVIFRENFSKQIMRLRFCCHTWLISRQHDILIKVLWALLKGFWLPFFQSLSCQSFIKVKAPKVVINLNKTIRAERVATQRLWTPKSL